MRKRIIKRAFIFVLLLITVLFTVDLIVAKYKTKRIVDKALHSPECELDISKIDKAKITQLLAIEDPEFYTHNGLDFHSPGAGWTTISQGLVKIFYFNNFRPGIRKIRLFYITRFVFDPSVPKNDQLSLFFNYAYFGNDDEGKVIRGFANAAKFFYKKSFDKLTNDEYLSLVASLMNPNQYRVDKYPENNKDRVSRIKRFLAGECHPVDWKDCELEGCK